MKFFSLYVVTLPNPNQQAIIPNISNILALLHQLLKKEAKWEWTSKQEQAWEEAKELLNSPKVLVHFDPSKAVTVASDASPYGWELYYLISWRMDPKDQ